MVIITVPARFNGPPGSAHGGYCSGTVADLVGASVAAELRAPPPLEVPMTAVDSDEGLDVYDGETLVVRARRAPPPDLQPPATVTRAAAEAAVERYEGFVDHPFPSCFVCGPARPQQDGLRIFPGQVDHAGVVAAPWVPQPWTAGADGAVAPAFVWAALDCPAAFGLWEWARRAGHGTAVVVLASMRVRQEAPVPVGDELVVLGWGRGVDGRKGYAGSAIQSSDGTVLAVADTLWIQPARLSGQPAR